MARHLALGWLILFTAGSVSAETARCSRVAAPPPAAGATPKVELVFALDATGSMGSLIEGAKTKIWSIVNAIARAQPTPEIRIGIVAYRDRGDEFVTRRTPLDAELDAAYAWLIGQSAAGGGDGPESVRQALREAVENFDWSGDPATLRMIYLVGDAPPHEDYPDDVATTESAVRARSKGIVIHTIQCGSSPETAVAWNRIAEMAGGDYLRIEQSGGMTARTTRFDAELARHARLLERTVVPYGVDDADREERTRRIEEGASEEALAERATFIAGEAGLARTLADRDLVRLVIDGRVAVEEVRRDALPEPLKSMEHAELRGYLEMLAERRRGLREEVAWLGERRRAELDGEGEADADAFDRRVIESLRCHAARIGLIFDRAK